MNEKKKKEVQLNLGPDVRADPGPKKDPKATAVYEQPVEVFMMAVALAYHMRNSPEQTLFIPFDLNAFATGRSNILDQNIIKLAQDPFIYTKVKGGFEIKSANPMHRLKGRKKDG